MAVEETLSTALATLPLFVDNCEHVYRRPMIFGALHPLEPAFDRVDVVLEGEALRKKPAEKDKARRRKGTPKGSTGAIASKPPGRETGYRSQDGPA
jgi:hypothetical protein